MLRPGDSLASLVSPTLPGGGDFTFGAFAGMVAQSRRPIRYARERVVLRGRDPTGWYTTVTGCKVRAQARVRNGPSAVPTFVPACRRSYHALATAMRGPCKRSLPPSLLAPRTAVSSI